MILYCSATGNTKLIAGAIAEHLQDESLDLLPRIQSKDYSDIVSDQPFAICSPIYVSELPVFLTEYLITLPIAPLLCHLAARTVCPASRIVRPKRSNLGPSPKEENGTMHQKLIYQSK